MATVYDVACLAADALSTSIHLSFSVPSWLLLVLTLWLLAVFLARKIITKICALFYIANASRRAQLGTHTFKNRRMQVHVVRPKFLDATARLDLFDLVNDMVDVNVADTEATARAASLFERYLESFEFALIFRDMVDGSLRGMMLLSRNEYEGPNNRRVLVMQAGLALFREEYRGSGLFFVVVGYFMLWEMLRHLRSGFYISYKSYSYKSYLGAIESFENVWPRYDRSIPEFEKSMIDEMGMRVMHGSETYDPSTCVVNREDTALRADAAPITEEDMKNPHIRFFQQQNPGWHRGNLLIVLAKVGPKDVWNMVWRGIVRMLGRGKGIRRTRGKVVATHAQFNAEQSQPQQPSSADGDKGVGAASTDQESNSRASAAPSPAVSIAATAPATTTDDHGSADSVSASEDSAHISPHLLPTPDGSVSRDGGGGRHDELLTSAQNACGCVRRVTHDNARHPRALSIAQLIMEPSVAMADVLTGERLFVSRRSSVLSSSLAKVQPDIDIPIDAQLDHATDNVSM